MYEEGDETLTFREKLSDDAYARQLAGLTRSKSIGYRKHKGEKFMTERARGNMVLRHKVRLKENTAKEAREIQAMMKEHTKSALDRIIDIINDDNSKPSDVISATHFLYDRAYGKALQTNLTQNLDANGKPNEITAKELDARIKAALDRVERATGGEGQAQPSQEQPADVCVSDLDPGGSSKH